MIDWKSGIHPRAVPAANEVESYGQMLDQAGDTETDAQEEPAPVTPETNLPLPESVQAAYQTTWKSLLANNLGRNVIVSFLMGTQSTVVAEGVLYEVGSDYLVLYQPSRDSYITADLYSVKFVEFRAADNRTRV